VKDVAKKALDAVKLREAEVETRNKRYEEIMALKVAAQETKEALAESQGNVLDAKNERAQMGRCVGLVGVAAAYIVLNRASK
jgi:hypothetical protein